MGRVRWKFAQNKGLVPADRSLTRTSPGPACGSGTSSTEAPVNRHNCGPALPSSRPLLVAADRLGRLKGDGGRLRRRAVSLRPKTRTRTTLVQEWRSRPEAARGQDHRLRRLGRRGNIAFDRCGCAFLTALHRLSVIAPGVESPPDEVVGSLRELSQAVLGHVPSAKASATG